MTATPDITASHTPERDSAVGRELALYGVAAAVVVAAVVGAGRYGWLLHHNSDNFDDPLESGWQVTLAKVGIGSVIVAVGLLAGYAARRLGPPLADRTPHTRAVRFASLLPGILLGVAVLHPIDATLTWASDHTSQAAVDRAEDKRIVAGARKQLLEERKAPLRISTRQPAAPRAMAQRLVSTATLGAGWYSLQSPASSVVPVPSTLQSEGATSVVRTTVARATRMPTGWQLNIYVDERSTIFRSASEAREYARNYRQGSTKPCNCEPASQDPVTISRGSTMTIDGVVVHRWLETSDTRSHPDASFNVGKQAYTIFAAGFAAKALSNAETVSLLRTAVGIAKTGR